MKTMGRFNKQLTADEKLRLSAAIKAYVRKRSPYSVVSMWKPPVDTLAKGDTIEVTLGKRNVKLDSLTLLKIATSLNITLPEIEKVEVPDDTEN